MCLLHNLNDSRLSNFALDYYAVNYLQSFHKFDKNRSIYQLTFDFLLEQIKELFLLLNLGKKGGGGRTMASHLIDFFV